MYQDLIDYKNGTTEQAKIYPEFIPETPLPPLDCDEIKSCVGIDQSGGDPDLVLNQQGDWISKDNPIDCDEVKGCIGITPSGNDDYVLNQKGVWISNNTNQFQYEIGQYVPSEGGVIYHRYIDNGVQYYLVVDTAYLGQTYWSDDTSTYVYAESTWDGQSNTNIILASPGTKPAATNCNNSTRNGKSDWYLPAISEMSLIGTNKFNVDKTLSGNSSYGAIPGATVIGTDGLAWTSNANNYFSPGVAMAYDLGVNTFTSYAKNSVWLVRAVRKFNIP
jgi:hypothetical protein